MIRFLNWIFLFPLVMGTALGANWYVDGNATGSNKGTSWANAWVNPTNIVWASVNPGDTIFVSGGTTSQIYTDSLFIGKDGTPGNYITVRIGQDAGHNGVAIFERCGIGMGSCAQWNAIDGGRSASFVDPTNHDQVIHGPTAITNNIGFWIRNITSTNTADEDISPVLWFFRGPNNLRFSYIEVSGLTNNNPLGGDYASAGAVCSGRIDPRADTTNITFQYLYLYNNAGREFQWNGSTASSFDNVVFKFGWINLCGEDHFQCSGGWTIRDSVIGPVDGMAPHVDLFQMQGNFIKIYNNDVRESVNSIFRIQTDPGPSVRHDIWFFNNLVTEKLGRSFAGGTENEYIVMVQANPILDDNETYSNIFFLNNLFYNSVTNRFSGNYCGTPVFNFDNGDCTNGYLRNIIFENNLIVDKQKGFSLARLTNGTLNGDGVPLGWDYFTTNDFVVNYNVLVATNTQLQSPMQFNYRNTNTVAGFGPYAFMNRTNYPMFVDTVNDNFELSPLDTVALNNGADLSVYFNFDSLNRPRNVGGAWDIGPLEYQGSSSTNGSGGSPRSFARVQFKKGSYPSTSVTFNSPNTAGNAIIVSVVTVGLIPSSITDTAGNSYSLVDSANISASTSLSVYAAFGIAAYSGNVVTANGSLTYPGLTAVEYSGVTSVNTFGHVTAYSPYNALSVTLNTSAATMLFSAWGDEYENGLSSTSLTPGSISGSQIDFDSGLYAGNYEWLNSASGFAAGNYTVTANTSGGNCVWVVVALQGNGSTNGGAPTIGNGPTNGLIVWLTFDQDFSTGGGVLLDSSGNGNNAYRFGRIGSVYPTNFPTRILSSGISGRTNLTGSDYAGSFVWWTNNYGLYGKEGQYAGITNVAQMKNMGTATIMCWARYYTPPYNGDYSGDANATLLSSGVASGVAGTWGFGRLNVNIWANNTRFYVATNGNADLAWVDFNDNGFDNGGDTLVWHHYCATWNNGVLISYYDGLPFRTNDVSAQVTRLRIGSNNNNPTPWIGVGCDTHGGTPPLGDEHPGIEYPNADWMDGAMDDVRIYNTVLSAGDVRAVYSSSVPKPKPAAPTQLRKQ